MLRSVHEVAKYIHIRSTFYYTFSSAIWKTATSGNPLVLKVLYNPPYTVQYLMK